MRFMFCTLIFALVGLSSFGQAQKADSVSSDAYISGTASLTHNGISLIPNFSLSKPAALFSMVIEKGRFSFEPEANFSLQGKPWYQLYWLRYKAIKGERFLLNVGTHLGLNFRDQLLQATPDSGSVIATERYLVGELFPRFVINDYMTVGVYYLHARAFDIGTSEGMHFVTLNTNFSNIPLGKRLYLGLNPQVYYLYLYGEDGFYFTSSLSLSASNLPVSLKATVNNVIQTDIATGKAFLWSLTAVYSFGRRQIVAEMAR